ncbi:MAG: hypothetical protein RL066_746, partial [Actinomycetota bacterium]
MNNGSVLITGGRSPIALSIAERLSLHTTVILLTRDITTFPSSDYDNNANILIRQLDLLQDSCRSNFNSLMIEFNITMLCFAHRL